MATNFSSSIGIKISKILAGMMDAKDGKDEKITGSIWNEFIANNTGSMTMGENTTITVPQAFNVLQDAQWY